MHSTRFLLAGLPLLMLAGRAALAQPVPIDLRRPQTVKDLSRCALGADAEDFAVSGVEYADLLGPRRAEFAQVMKESGVKVFRFATMQRYDYAGAEASTKLAQLSGQKELSYQWFEPELLFTFCRENDLRVIAMVNLPHFYDTQAGKALEAARYPMACARNAARFVSWVKEKGYSDQVVAWELGNETYGAWCEPDIWARVNVECARAMKAADPSIKVAVPGFAVGAQWAAATTDEGKTYVEWTTFSRDSLAATGRDARLFDYLVLHLYGGSETYNANGIGPENFRRDLIRPNPNLKHLRFIVTEWRSSPVGAGGGSVPYPVGGARDLSRSPAAAASPTGYGVTGDPDTGDQTFLHSALLHGKVTADLLADPQIDWIGGVHSLHLFGGLIYVSDGKVWSLWEPGKSRIPDPLAKPRMALGPHAVVMRWLNEAIRDCPRLVDTGDTAGHFSSMKLLQEGNEIAPGVQWLATMDAKGARLHLLVFNTHPTPELLDVRLPAGWAQARVATAEAYVTDDPFARFRTDSDRQPWRIDPLPGAKAAAGAVQVALPPLSVSRLVVQEGQPVPAGTPGP